jgi:putative endonuclease
MTNASRTLYVGVTNNLDRRVSDHESKSIAGFTRSYNITRLVYFEEFSDIRYAIAREKQMKSWRRRKKLALIELTNPIWEEIQL